jgi:predicted TIM-barrel fold metal-dependent hydrolase
MEEDIMEAQDQSTEKLGYRIFDADNHYYEQYDAFTRHIESKYKDDAVHVKVGEDGLGRTYIRDQQTSFVPVMPCDSIGLPGSYRGMISANNEDPSIAEQENSSILISPRTDPEYQAYVYRKPRLELMDKQGVEAMLVFPTAAVNLEYELYRHLPADAVYANLRAYNRWLDEEWGFNYDGRIFSTPMLSLFDLPQALEELDRVLKAGARFVHLCPGPAYSKSPADPYFDPFWARVEEAGVPVGFHIADNRYNYLYADIWGWPARASLWEYTPFMHFMGLGDRPICDTLASLVLGDLFTRFPKLKVLSVENGCKWVGSLLQDMDKAAHQSRYRGMSNKRLPSQVFKEHIYVVPFWEDNVLDLINLIGVDQVLAGSDFPHPEGEANPIDFVRTLPGLSDGDVRKIMRDNSAKLARLGS